MRQILLGVILLALMLPVQAGEFWDKLWRNADQRGDALLHQGDAQAAAKVYADPRRKAYAQLQAGDYKHAAQTLKNLHDVDDDYNRGNALAHVGDLAGALLSYDAALKRNPDDKDARHNRELVADALKRKPPQDRNRQNSSAQNNAQQGQDRNAAQQKPSQTAKGEASGKAQDKDASDGKPMDRKQSTQSGDESNGLQQQGSKSDASKASRDAKAGLARQAEKGDRIPAEKSEQQVEEEQWLHSIPDDPGGLLRRKFLIEHMLRQGAEP